MQNHYKTPTNSQHRTTISLYNFNKYAYSLSDPTSIWVVVNKQRPINPITYAPEHLVIPDIQLRLNITVDEELVSSVIDKPLENLVAAAKANGLTINLQSGYRSYDFQKVLYNGYVKQQGQAMADLQSARPGYSEHQTGLAVDVGGASNPSCNISECFAATPEGRWLSTNAFKYGFIIRYPQGRESVTGYEYEPWHLRYVGTTLSVAMQNTYTDTLERFFNLGSAPAYK